MHLHEIAIKNFRLLADAKLVVENTTTVVVGRNNSGKTSLTELFRRLLSDTSPTFRLEDFSLSVHEQFWNAAVRKQAGDEDAAVRDLLPVIEVSLTVHYAPNDPGMALLSEFIIDLDPACTDALISIRYQLRDGAVGALFQDIAIDLALPVDPQRVALCRILKDRVPKLFTTTIHAVDPSDPTNTKRIEWSSVRSLLHGGFINAQRGLDDVTHKDSDVLAHVLETLFRTATRDTADEADRTLVRNLENAVKTIQQNIDADFNRLLINLLPAFTLFGYPGLTDPRLNTETNLNVERLMTNHTTVHYAGTTGVNLPEAYNGLGARNLIYILLKLLEFFKSYRTAAASPGMHIVFIEEPEVHLHPQMQAVFIGKLNELAGVFATTFSGGQPWPVQFVVTTHSSHVANKAPFDSMRYFLAAPTAAAHERTTVIKDLRHGLRDTPAPDREFLHKYMTLTRCDLLFADKAILIEGTTERILLPRMIATLEAHVQGDTPLSSQYLSVVEVGGAYAHLFFDLLTFLEIPTLIITDLDSVKPNAAGDREACLVSEGTHTSNACLKKWFDDANITPVTLIAKSAADKTTGNRRLAYQVPQTDGAPCGRSFEAAFVLANPGTFGLSDVSQQALEAAAAQTAASVGKKSDFAVKYALQDTNWTVPRYIGEGLEWLAQVGSTAPPAAAAPIVATTPPETAAEPAGAPSA
jgi:putative ATP-dependent endonuclease of the OLD family